MNLKIREIRKNAHISQADLASKICVSLRTIGSWERGETIPDAEQLWNCAEALNCTPNDILGWYESHPKETMLEDLYERELIGCYRESTVQRQANILQTARDAAGMSKEAAEPAVHEPERREAM